ncbi:MAG: tripartite tricarboxylate transporter substrate binding protein [Acetobacteraceae bacterium]|nr:tripartite tricarboxylate transporter substrate binding protein [Acetobacteraceae bacterium]
MTRALLLLVVLLAPLPAAAQGGERVLTIISPWQLGANATIRAVADSMGRALGQTAVVVVRDGGSGVVGMQVLAASPADGNTVAYAAITPLVVQPHLVRGIGYRLESFASVCNVTENVLGIVVRPDSPFRGMPDLVAEARRRSLSYGSPGPNSVPQIGVEKVRAAAGGEYEHLPFRGDQQPILEVLAGRLDFAAIVVASGGEMLKIGRLRLLGVFSSRRHPEFPDTPTMQEQGIAALQHSFAGMHAPAGTPAPVLDRLEAACRQAMTDPVFLRVAAANGVVADFRPRAEQDRLLRELYEDFGRSLRELGVRPQ